LPTLAAAGRVLAQVQRAPIDAPPLDNSAMDGYAVAVADVRRVPARLSVAQRIPAGSVGTPLQPGTAARIFTGAPIPAGADAVVMQELCEHAPAK
jgi:molybdopterin molybdotransferase